MQSKFNFRNKALAIGAIILSLASLAACSSTRKAKAEESGDNKSEKSDSVEVFVPTHPPVVVPHTWREAMGQAE